MSLLTLEWKKVGWLNIASSVASFPWPGLPNDVHFSLSYSPNSDMMNLHLSRNVAGVPPENKPQIRIAQWPKAEMEEMAKIFIVRYWQQMWEPFDMQKFQYRPSGRGKAARYCSITGLLEKGREQVVHRQLKAHIHKHLIQKRKGRHLVIQEEMIPALEQMVLRPEFFWKVMNMFKRVPRQFVGQSEFGYLHARAFSGMVVRYQAQWFTYKKDVDFSSILQEFFEPDVFTVLKEKIAEAVTIISRVTTKKEALPFSQPIDLIIIRE